MRNFINIVAESFTNAVPVSWRDHSNEDLRLLQAHFQIDDGHFVVQFQMPYYNAGYWEMSFTRNNELTLSGTGKAPTVLATVMQAAREFIEAVEPRWISFAADVNEPSRSRLYPKLTAIMMKEFPQFTASPPKVGRKHVSYEVGQPAKPWVMPEPAPKPKYEQPTADDFADIEAWLEGGDR